jgi:hypothetical protein
VENDPIISRTTIMSKKTTLNIIYVIFGLSFFKT